MLSICAIARNEEKNIVAFVNSWMPLCDELIIVDTGSTDETINLANGINLPREKFRIVKSNLEFEDGKIHFADARNESIEYCAGDWILWADLDDRLDINSIARIKEIISRPPAKTAYAFQIASDVGNGNWSRFMQVRLFPAHPNLRFEGRIHEKLAPALVENGFKIAYENEVIVAHLGYADMEVRKQKAIRNLELLNMEEQSEETLIQCADAFCVLGKWETALSCYRQAIKVSMTVHATRERLAENIVKCLVSLGRLDEAEREVKSQMLMDATLEWFYWAGEIAFLKGNFNEAAGNFKHIEFAESVMGQKTSDATTLANLAKERMKQMEGR